MINGVPVVAAPAEIDVIAAGQQLRAVLLDSAARGHATVVVDMTGTVLCGCSGPHTLLRAHKRAVSEGSELRLVVSPDSAVPRVVRPAGLDRLISCFSSLAQALAPSGAGATVYRRRCRVVTAR